jgi:integrase/recombinase XerD
MSASSSPNGRRRLNTVREVCQEFLDRVLSVNTGSSYKTRRKEIVEFMDAHGELSVQDAISDDLEKYIEERDAWKSNYTKKRVAATIARPFSWAFRKGLIDRHPFIAVTYPRGERGRPMEDRTFRLILRNSTAEVRRILLFLSWVGCRPGEACAIKWEHIDPTNGTVVLHQHKTAKSRKDQAPRVIVLPQKALRLLTWMLDDQRAEQEYVFLNRLGKRWTRCQLNCRVRRTRKQLGLPKTVRLYGLRHAAITRMLLTGGELAAVSLLAGHSSIVMTQRYVHLEGEIDHLRKTLENSLNAKPKDKP